MKKIIDLHWLNYWVLFVLICLSFSLLAQPIYAASVDNPQSGSVGLVGTIPSPPPSSAATISTPSNGQTFTSQPVTVSGICKTGLLIKIFINNVFSGAAECTNGSYSVQVALFNGSNSIVAEDFDSLNQQGPNSNVTNVTFNSPQPTIGSPITLTSNYAKLGADPGSVLTWPLIISGGTPPYALSVDWGDGQPQELVSQLNSGTFNVSHTYNESGIYNVLVRATDINNNVAYLQLVGVANGAISQSSSSGSNNTTKKQSVKLSDTTLYVFAAVIIILSPLAFWLGSRHRLNSIRDKLQQGERPF